MGVWSSSHGRTSILDTHHPHPCVFGAELCLSAARYPVRRLSGAALFIARFAHDIHHIFPCMLRTKLCLPAARYTVRWPCGATLMVVRLILDSDYSRPCVLGADLFCLPTTRYPVRPISGAAFVATGFPHDIHHPCPCVLGAELCLSTARYPVGWPCEAALVILHFLTAFTIPALAC